MKYLRARRGQAFETMMLVISVIVALAILAVLLNILNIVKIFNPSSPKDVMSSGLKEIQSKGYGITSPSKVTFTKDAVITRTELISDIPIKATAVNFVCDDTGTSGVCGSGNPIEVANNQLKINANIEVYVVTCGDEGHSGGAMYCISVASTGALATSKCTAKCSIV